MKVVMTVAGSDSGGGAGIQADLKTFSALRVYGTTAITALTAQNTRGVESIHTVPSSFVVEQMEAIFKDMKVYALKTGMLANADIIEAVADTCRKWEVKNLVVDPVMAAKSGDRLLEEDALIMLRERIFPQALVITPNLVEAGILLGEELDTEEKIKEAARQLHQMGPEFVIIKGGHFPGDEVADLIYDSFRFRFSRVSRVETTNNHGTGCTYSAALAALTARGKAMQRAAEEAHNYVHLGLQQGYNPGQGTGCLHHMAYYYREMD